MRFLYTCGAHFLKYFPCFWLSVCWRVSILSSILIVFATFVLIHIIGENKSVDLQLFKSRGELKFVGNHNISKRKNENKYII